MPTFNRTLLWLLGVALLFALLWFFGDIVSYILMAWVLSMLGRPLMIFFMRRTRVGNWHLGRSGAALLTMLTFLLILAGIIMLFVPTLVQQARNFGGLDYAALGARLQTTFDWADAQAHAYGLIAEGETLMVRAQEALSKWFKPALVGTYLGSFIATAGSVIVTFTVVFFILFFFLKDSTLFLQMLYAVVPTHLEPKVRHAVDRSSTVLTRYFGGLVTQIAAFTAMVTVVLLVLGVKNALLIGAFGGFLNVVPYVGPIIGLLFGCFITVSSNLTGDFATLWPLLLKVAAAFAIAQVIDNTFLSTIIFSKSVQAHPLEIFLVTLVAAKIGGVLGMVLGIPVYTVLRVIAQIFFSEFKVVQRLTENLDDEG
jgi:predicted PurR-regulated permease PerM